MSDIKIIALGGVRENAKNLYIVEINDSIFILDAGLKYPENEQLGVDFVIPNLDYLMLALRNSTISMLLTQRLKLNLRMLRFHSSRQLTLFQNQWGLFLALTKAILFILVTSSLTKLHVLTTKLI